MAELGLRAYRFSVAWARIQPEGRGPANPRGLDHYRRLVEALLERGIAPVVTLYHWDLPQGLEDAGGWPSRATAERFGEYAAIVHDALGSMVEHWITVNEPWVAAWLGYGTGVHAPGKADDDLALAATHHLLLAHGLAREAMGRPVGIALNLEPHRPASDDPADVALAHLADLHMNALFLDPLFGRGYPRELVDRYRPWFESGVVRDGDLERIAGPLGFLGVNYYRPQIVTADRSRRDRTGAVPGSLGGWYVVPAEAEVTSMGWPIDASGLRDLLDRLHRAYGPSRVLLTENGAAFDDTVGPDGLVGDHARIEFLRAHVRTAYEALVAGVPVLGYLVWSLLDNFEWTEGYAKRFGLVYVDFASQRRIPKASARWFREAIAESGSTSSLLMGPEGGP